MQDMEFDQATDTSNAYAWSLHDGYRQLAVQQTNFQEAKSTFQVMYTTVQRAYGIREKQLGRHVITPC